MCFTSIVMDQFNPYIPNPNQWTWADPAQAQRDAAELRELLNSFRQMMEGAKTFDRLTGQPDCEDPEKAKIEERVAELERRLDALSEALR